MLRILFVALIIILGAFSSLRGPFFALQFYLWNAYFRPEEWLWTDALYQVRLSLLIYVFLIGSALTKIQSFRLTRPIALIVLFLAHSLLSAILSEHQDISLTYWVEFLKVIGILLFITFLVSDEKKFRITFLVIAYSLGFEATKQGWAQMILNPGATNNNPHPFLGDNNGVAHGMFMLIPLFTALVLTARTGWEKRLHQFFIVGLAYRGISTYSRGGFIAGGVLALLTVWRSRHKVRTFIGVAVLAAVVFSVMPERYFLRMDTIDATEEERDSSAAGRLHYWQVARLMAQAKPLTGIGFNGFRDSYSTYEFEQGWGTMRSVHSAWFGVLAEMGYPGLIMFCSILFVAFNTTRKVRKRAIASNNGAMAAYATALQSSLVVYAVGATFLSAQYNEMFWHLIGLTIALDRIQREAVSDTVPALVPTQQRAVPATAAMAGS
jgi:probable O-glycosylation ligase (exosortase A-associated)